VNLAVFLFTTSETRGRDTIKISAASACFSPCSAIQPDNSSINCFFNMRVSLICFRAAAMAGRLESRLNLSQLEAGFSVNKDFPVHN